MSTRVIYQRYNWFHITHRTPPTRCEIMDLSQIVTSHTIKHAPKKKYDQQFRIVFDAIRELVTPPAKPRRKIGFERKERIE